MPFGRKGVVNFKNSDNKCFMYCVSAGLHWEEIPEKERRNSRVWKKYFEKHDFSDVSGGNVNVHTDVPCFERKNSCNINVFSHKENNIILVRESKKSYQKTVSLFLIHERVGSDTKYHFALKTDVNKFLATGNTHKSYFCHQCFKRFTKEQQYMIHISSCGKPEEEQQVNFPEPWKRLKFSRPEATISYPFLLYYDFETFGVPVDDREKGKGTIVNHEYTTASYSIAVVENVKGTLRLVKFEYYDGEDVVNHFFNRLFTIARSLINEIRETNNIIIPTEEVLRQHEAATNCKFCNREFGESNVETKDEDLSDCELLEEGMYVKTKVVKTFHHNHFTGKFEISCSFNIQSKIF